MNRLMPRYYYLSLPLGFPETDWRLLPDHTADSSPNSLPRRDHRSHSSAHRFHVAKIGVRNSVSGPIEVPDLYGFFSPSSET